MNPVILKISVSDLRYLPIMNASNGSTNPYCTISLHHHRSTTKTIKKSLTPIMNHSVRFELESIAELQDNPLVIRVLDRDDLIESRYDVIGGVNIDLNCLLSARMYVGECKTDSDLVKKSKGRLEGYFPIFDSLKGLRGEINLSMSLELMNPLELVAVLATKNIHSFSSPQIGPLVEELLVDQDPEHNWMTSWASMRTSNEQRQQIFYKLSCQLKRRMMEKTQKLGYNALFGYTENFDLEDDNGIIIRGMGTACKLQTSNLDSPTLKPKLSNPSSFPKSLSPRMNFVKSVKRIRLCTLNNFPEHQIKKFGGLVVARSVKLCHKLDKNRKELQRIHDEWWNELRDEIRNHARQLNCSDIIGYRENVHLYRDVCVLQACGTAAVLRPTPKKKNLCKIVHLPFSPRNAPYEMETHLCANCKKYAVPSVLLSTTELPSELPSTGNAKLIQVRVCRKKKKKNSDEESAKHVSSLLPFVEYEVHKQLIHSLRLHGVNSAWGLTYDLSIGPFDIICTATCTIAYIPALMPPTPLTFKRTLEVINENDKIMVEMQKTVEQLSIKNCEENNKGNETNSDFSSDSDSSDTEDGKDDLEAIAMIEIDDDADEDQMAALLVPTFPKMLSLHAPNHSTPSEFTLIQIQKRYVLNPPPDKLNQHVAAIFTDILDEVNRQAPSKHSRVYGIETRMRIEKPDELEIDLLGTFVTPIQEGSGNHSSSKSEEFLFHFDDVPESPSIDPPSSPSPSGSPKSISQEPKLLKDSTWKKNHFVHVTNLNSIPGYRIHMVSRISIHFVRETESTNDVISFVRRTYVEAQILLRSRARALSCNAILNYTLKQHSVVLNQVRKSAYLLLSVEGDACVISQSS